MFVHNAAISDLCSTLATVCQTNPFYSLSFRNKNTKIIAGTVVDLVLRLIVVVGGRFKRLGKILINLGSTVIKTNS